MMSIPVAFAADLAAAAAGSAAAVAAAEDVPVIAEKMFAASG